MVRVGDNLYRRGKHCIYYARINRNGKDCWKSLKTSNRAVAKAELTNLEKSLQNTTVTAGAGKPPALAALIEQVLEKYQERRDYKSFSTIKQRLRNIARSPLGAKPVNRITTEQIERCLLTLNNRHHRDKNGSRTQDTKIANSTRNRYLNELKKVFEAAKRWRPDNPCLGVKRFPERAEERITPTPEEVQAVLAPLRDGRIRRQGRQAADFIEFLALSGCRVSEASELTWDRVYFDGDYMLIRGKSVQETKFKERKVPLFPPLCRLLENLRSKPEAEPSGLVFSDYRVENYYPRKALDSAQKVIGVQKESRFSFHGLRHFFATQCVLRSIPFTVIAQWLGHSDGGELVARRYGNHVRGDQVQDFVARVDFTSPAN